MMYADSILAAYDEYIAAQAAQAEIENVFADDEFDVNDDAVRQISVQPPRRHDSTASEVSTIDTPVEEGYVP